MEEGLKLANTNSKSQPIIKSNIRTQNEKVRRVQKNTEKPIIIQNSLVKNESLVRSEFLSPSFLEKQADEFEDLREEDITLTQRKTVRKEITEHDKSLLGYSIF